MDVLIEIRGVEEGGLKEKLLNYMLRNVKENKMYMAGNFTVISHVKVKTKTIRSWTPPPIPLWIRQIF